MRLKEVHLENKRDELSKKKEIYSIMAEEVRLLKRQTTELKHEVALSKRAVRKLANREESLSDALGGWV